MVLFFKHKSGQDVCTGNGDAEGESDPHSSFTFARAIVDEEGASQATFAAETLVVELSSYQPSTRKCNLCNVEKTLILYSTDTNLLNKRSELLNKCRHRNKHLLEAVT